MVAVDGQQHILLKTDMNVNIQPTQQDWASSGLLGGGVPNRPHNIVHDGSVESGCTEVGAVQLLFRQIAERGGDCLIGDVGRFIEMFALGNLCHDAGGSDSCRTSKTFEPYIDNMLVPHLNPYFQHIATIRIADLPDTVGVGYLAHVARIPKMVFQSVGIICNGIVMYRRRQLKLERPG